MTHTWKAAGSGGRWVHHSSRADGTASDSIGVGLGEDVLGPFTSRKMARIVAYALNSAYQAGKKDGLPDDTAEMLDRAYAAMDPDEGSNDAEHESLTELAELVAGLTGYVNEPLDGKTLIAGVLYDEDGYESEEDATFEPELDSGGNPVPLRRPAIGNMEPGAVGYTVPWAMVADKKERLWLNPGYPVSPEPHGTATLRVERRRSDYTVRVPRGETYAPGYLWQKDLLPVAVVEEAGENKA